MIKPRKSAEETRQLIMTTARGLFARYGVNGVSIRMIGEAADINHTLVIRHFGSKENLWAQVLENAVNYFAGFPSTQKDRDPAEVLARMRRMFLQYLTNDDVKTALMLIMRAEMDGLAPSSIVSQSSERLVNKTARIIRSLQTGSHLPDPDVAAVIIMGSMASLVTISPWLLSAVDLTPDDYERRKGEFVDMLINMIAHFTGLPAEVTSQ